LAIDVVPLKDGLHLFLYNALVNQEDRKHMVSATMERLSSCKVKFDITMPADMVNDIRKVQEKQVQKETQIQGFRKGNAPLHMVKNLYAGTIEKNTLDEAMQQAFEQGLSDSDIQPVGYPVVKNFDYDDDKNLKMEVEIETYPEIELKKYKDFKFEKTIYKIEDSDINDNIDYIRKQKSIISEEQGPAQMGQYITLSLQELDETGMPLIGKKYDDLRVQLGEGQFDPDLEEQIVGINTGEERIVEKKYSESAGKEFAGKLERFKVTAVKIENEEMPELDDQFAQDLNLDIKTVEELRNKVREELEHRWGQESEQRFYHKMAQEILHENPFDVPDSMVDNYLDRIVEDIRKKEQKFDEEEVRKHYRADAIFNIKWYHLKDKIAKQENIEANDDDFKTFLDELEDDRMREFYSGNEKIKESVLSDIFEKKVFDFLVKSSKIKEKKESINTRKEFANV
jgi:trigger factor